MASAINSSERNSPLSSPELRRALARFNRPVALLVLRILEFERIAWREGKRRAHRAERIASRCFLRSADTALRAGDFAAHDAGSDVFTIALAAPSRESREPSALDCRAVLERIARALATETRMQVETGWTMIEPGIDVNGLAGAVRLALERGARERERYEFFAAVGHELRTPLSSIRGYLETLLDDPMDPKMARLFLQTAQREALRMGRLLDGMFEFSLLDLSAVTISAASCNVDEQIARACEIVGPAATANSITFERVSGTTQPSQLCAAIDSDACLQLVVNLLDNAVKYGNEGGTVRIETSLHDGVLSLVVDDDGPGIAEGERSSIFSLRVRGNESGSRPGSGIGLAIVKLIAERAGGSTRATASPLGGARFEVALPARAESAAAAS